MEENLLIEHVFFLQSECRGIEIATLDPIQQSMIVASLRNTNGYVTALKNIGVIDAAVAKKIMDHILPEMLCDAYSIFDEEGSYLFDRELFETKHKGIYGELLVTIAAVVLLEKGNNQMVIPVSSQFQVNEDERVKIQATLGNTSYNDETTLRSLIVSSFEIQMEAPQALLNAILIASKNISVAEKKIFEQEFADMIDEYDVLEEENAALISDKSLSAILHSPVAFIWNYSKLEAQLASWNDRFRPIPNKMVAVSEIHFHFNLPFAHYQI